MGSIIHQSSRQNQQSIDSNLNHIARRSNQILERRNITANEQAIIQRFSAERNESLPRSPLFFGTSQTGRIQDYGGTIQEPSTPQRNS
ncbi:MAG: hypothetical protein CMF43_00585 [Legionellales bacterium]|nr:hypothetical protein [Legionellales bacterium]